MVSARLLVERGSLRDRSEDWGDYRFLAMPSPGDRLTVRREEKTNFLTVLCVHHQPVRGSGDEGPPPSAHVVAKWTGADEG